MKKSVEERIELIKKATEPEDLRACICPFFKLGASPSCVSCMETDADVEDCKGYYLERIYSNPLDLWDETFDRPIVTKRDLVPIEDIVGIGITCDSCYVTDKCPAYKRGHACGIDWGSKRPNSPAEYYDFMIELQYERVRRASVFEKMDGGVPDANLSGELDRLEGLTAAKADLSRERVSIKMEATGAASGSGSAAGGILASIFGGKPAIEETPTIEIPTKAESMKDVAEVIEFTEEKVIEPIKVEENEGKHKRPRRRSENV